MRFVEKVHRKSPDNASLRRVHPWLNERGMYMSSFEPALHDLSFGQYAVQRNEVHAWVVQQLGRSRHPHCWADVGGTFMFQHPDDEFAFKMRWC